MLPAATLGGIGRLGLFAGITTAVVFSLAVGYQFGWSEGTLCALATGALVVVAVPPMLRRGVEPIEPIWFVVTTVAFGVTAKAFYVLFGPADRRGYLLLDKRPDDLLFAALLIASGLVCLSVGYMLGGLRFRLPRLDRLALVAPDPRRFIAIVGAMVVIGLLSFVLFSLSIDLSLDRLGDLSTKRVVQIEGSRHSGALGYLRWGALLIELAFYLALAYWFARRDRLRSRAGAAMLLFALLALAFPVFSSNRQTVAFVIIRAIVIWIAIRGEPRVRYVALLAAVALVIMGSMLSFRRGRTEWQEVRQHVEAGALLDMTVGSRYFLDLTKTAHVIDAVPRVFDYQYGKTMLTWLVAPVPRRIWPRKPSIGTGNEFGPEVFGTPRNTGVPPGIVGELYYNFGIAGILVGLLGLGLVLRSIWASLRPHFPGPGIVVIYAVLVTRLALGMMSDSVSGSTTKLLQEIIPLLLALWLSSYGRSSLGTARRHDLGDHRS